MCIFERSLKLLHRCRGIRVRGFDIAVLCYGDISLPQDSLNDLVGNSNPVKIRRQTTAKRMPTMPLGSCFGD